MIMSADDVDKRGTSTATDRPDAGAGALALVDPVVDGLPQGARTGLRQRVPRS